MTLGVLMRLMFDPQKVMGPLDKVTEKNLFKLGANVRQRARRILKYGQGSSLPGQPPIVHRIRRRGYSQPSSPVRDFLLFDVDPGKMEVVIGPKLISGRTGAVRKLEHGGTATTKQGKNIVIEPRPFMAPSFKAETMGVANYWKGSI